MDTAAALSQPARRLALSVRVTPASLAIGVTLLALVLRVTNLGGRPLWLDESFSSWFSEQSFSYLWHVLPTYEPHPPFYYSLLKIWRTVFGEGHVAMRSLSVLFGVLTVPLVLAIVAEQEKERPTGRPLLRAGLAGFLVACSPILLIIGQESRPYPLLTFSYGLAILALLRLARQFRVGDPGTWQAWLLLGLGTELTLWSHGLGSLYGLCLGLAVLPLWLSNGMSRQRLLRGASTASMIALAYVPCLVMMSGRTEDWGSNWLAWDPSMLLQLTVFYTVPVEALTVGSAVAALAMALLIKRGLNSTYRSEGWNADRTILLLWLGPPMVAALVSAMVVPVFLARTLTATLVPAYLMIAGAIARTEGERERRMITAAICITLLPTALTTVLRPSFERWDLASAFLSRNVRPGDVVWLYPSDSALPIADADAKIAGTVQPIPQAFPNVGYKGPIRAGWPAVKSVTPQQADAFARNPALKDVRVIWLVTRQSGIFDPKNEVPDALAKVRRAGPMQEWGYINVRPYYLRGR